MRTVLESPAHADTPLLLPIPEVARILALSRSRVYQMAHDGEIAYVRLGKSMRVPRAVLLALIDRQTVNHGRDDAAREERGIDRHDGARGVSA